jgi:hypothetical protein
MKPWMYALIGGSLWCAFVDVITPDLSFTRQAIGSLIGLTAFWLLAMAIPRSSDKHPKNTNEKTTQDENPN